MEGNVHFKGPGQWRSAAEAAQKNVRPPVTLSDKDGPLGTIALIGGRLTGSTRSLQNIADHAAAREGSPEAGYAAMATFSNGYIWAGPDPTLTG